MDGDVIAPRRAGQPQQPRVELGHDAFVLGTRIARVQRRQLDRQAGAIENAAPRGCVANRFNGMRIGHQILLRLRFGERGFAQHVIGMAKALGFARARLGQRFLNGFTRHELARHQPHGGIDGGAHQRLGALGPEPVQGGRQAFVRGRLDQLARDQ